MNNNKKRNHYVSRLSAHLIFVVKYRKKLLKGKIGDQIKDLLLASASSSKKFDIQTIEVDDDHVHMIINYEPTETISNIVKKLKSYSTYHLWKNNEGMMKHQFWKEKMFWTSSYFVCSVGDCSNETIDLYIQSQGGKEPIKRKIH